jgi:AraC-like DNA-binding protein
MKRTTEGIMYDTLAEQYRHLGLPTHLIDSDSEFTIFNLADLHQAYPFSSPVSRLNFFVVGFVKQARGKYVIDEQTFTLQPGTIYFTNPGHYRSFEYIQIDEVYLLTLSETFLKENVYADIFNEFPFLLAETFPAMRATPEIFAQFEHLYLQMHKEYISNSPFRKKLIGALFVALLLKYKEYFWLNYNPIQEGNRGSAIVTSFKLTLEKHYRDLTSGTAKQVFRLQDYADAQNLSPTYLSNVIKSKTGKAISTWVAEKSIAEAKSLLQNSSLAIKEVAHRLGFTDTAHFSNHFKKHSGSSPAAYRAAHTKTAP